MHRWFANLACLIALFVGAPAAWAQTTPIFRCIGAHGEPVFSGQPCANPVPAASANPAAKYNGRGSLCAGSPQALRMEIAQAFAAHDANRLAGLILWRGMGTAATHATMRGLTAWVRQPLAGITMAGATGPPLAAGAAPAQSVGLATPGYGTAQAGSEQADPHPLASDVTAAPPTGLSISTGGGDGSTRDFGITEIGGCWWLTF